MLKVFFVSGSAWIRMNHIWYKSKNTIEFDIKPYNTWKPIHRTLHHSYCQHAYKFEYACCTAAVVMHATWSLPALSGVNTPAESCIGFRYPALRYRKYFSEILRKNCYKFTNYCLQWSWWWFQSTDVEEGMERSCRKTFACYSRLCHADVWIDLNKIIHNLFPGVKIIFLCCWIKTCPKNDRVMKI